MVYTVLFLIHSGKGILVPILKKRNVDPTSLANYRPVTVSVEMSKLLEPNIFCISVGPIIRFNPIWFYLKKRHRYGDSTDHYVTSDCALNGSSIFSCSLGAKMAFEGLPHEIIFLKTMDIIPPNCWNFIPSNFSGGRNSSRRPHEPTCMCVQPI